MQSQFSFLRSGKLVLVRPWRLRPTYPRIVNSALRTPLSLQPDPRQNRYSTTYVAPTHEDLTPEKVGRSKYVTWRPLNSSHRSRQNLPTPTTILGEYLDIKDSSERTRLFERLADCLDPSRLASILLYYLHATSNLDVSLVKLDEAFFLSAHKYLVRRGMTLEDVGHWEWILGGDNPDAMIDRFFSCATPKPHFLLLEILRRDIREVASLNKVLVYLVEQNVAGQRMNGGQVETVHFSPIAEMEHNSFGILISRLLLQTRRIWPPAMVSIAHLIEPHFNFVMDKIKSPEDIPKKTAQLSEFLNYIIGLLSLPARANPLASVRHNWKAQKIMLELAGKFDPPLVLSQSSYRSIVQTLAATPKSEIESKSAVLRTRTWPPWRQDEDGMDAMRLPEEDLSRVLLAMFRSQEAGFRPDVWDDAIGIYGGMEPDGTPSIQTRRTLRKRREHSKSDPNTSSRVWAARVEATRDIQEAWSAFIEFRGRGGIPKQDIFMAMFEKLNYDLAVTGRKRPYTAPSGDGKEVLAVSNDNYTPYYIQHLQTPSLPMLYKEMLEMGIRPTGRCLNFLIRKARTTDEGLQYMLDSGIDRMVVRALAEGSSSKANPRELRKISDGVLWAYITLTCRLAARAVIQDTNRDSLSEDPALLPRFTFFEQEILGDNPKQWTVLEQRSSHPRHIRTRETFNHVSFLLVQSSTTFRPTWYAYFKALARDGAVIAREVVGNPKWDSLAWQRIKGALQDFHSLGLELEPEGFLHLCRCFQKFAGGPLGRFTKRYEGSAPKEAKIVRAAFTRLSKSQEASRNLPSLFHAIRGVHLHAYIRALGAAGDHDGIISALEWMVQHNEELQGIAQENRNGVGGFRRTIRAIRYLLAGSEYLEDAEELVKKVSWWGGWPSEADVVAYLRGSRVKFSDESLGVMGVGEDMDEGIEEDEYEEDLEESTSNSSR